MVKCICSAKSGNFLKGVLPMGQDKIEESSVEVLTDISRGTVVCPVKRRQTFAKLYKEFRQSGLSKLDSAFNAIYICQTNKFCSRTVDVNNVGEGFFAHPVGWFKEKEERVRRATRTKTLRFLELAAKVMSRFSRSVEPVKVRSGFFFDNSAVTLKNIRKTLKKAVPACVAVACSVLLFAAVYADSEKNTVIEFSINGVAAGEVASVDTVDEALERVTSGISLITGKAFSFPYEISYSIKNTGKSKCLDINGVCDVLYSYTDDYTAEGYGLYIDSELIAVLDNRDDILEVLETVKSEHMKLTGEDEDIANKIEIKYQEYSPDILTTKEDLLSKFSIEDVQAEEIAPHRALLSEPTSLTTLSLEAATPEFREMMESAMTGSSRDAIVLDFAVYYEETARESVPYETTYILDDSYYEGQEIVRVAGRNGTADNTYKVKYVEGEEAGRVLVEQNIIREPRTCIIISGTRAVPERMSPKEHGGKYMINPVPAASVSSRFGWRVLRGRSDFHEGLDLAAWKGTSIYAAASGEVIYAGYSQSYGNHIKIRHEDGLVTLYAHCSELLVETGDTVSQADKIGLVGSTGNSTGYHCHFEVYEDGERVNPEKYIYSID